MGEDEKQELLDKELVEIEAKLAARSMSGSPSRRNPNRKIKMTYRDYRKRLIAFGVSISVVTGLLIGLYNSHIRQDISGPRQEPLTAHRLCSHPLSFPCRRASYRQLCTPYGYKPL